ncbi:MAG: hypothetical protein JXB47_12710 [Anaerolineae bacterium]|nr:hypothetical protein [Anaerolineae bacterium]
MDSTPAHAWAKATGLVESVSPVDDDVLANSVHISAYDDAATEIAGALRGAIRIEEDTGAQSQIE